MRKLISIAVLLLIGLASFAQASNENRIIGTWISESRDGKVEIYRQGNLLYGKIVWTKNDGAKDDKNPDPKKRNQLLLGLVILNNFKEDGNNKWTGGTIYDPETGKTYSCNMKLNGKNLEIRGYVGVSLFGRTSIWTRN